jgi:hypothetical protein
VCSVSPDNTDQVIDRLYQAQKLVQKAHHLQLLKYSPAWTNLLEPMSTLVKLYRVLDQIGDPELEILLQEFDQQYVTTKVAEVVSVFNPIVAKMQERIDDLLEVARLQQQA